MKSNIRAILLAAAAMLTGRASPVNSILDAAMKIRAGTRKLKEKRSSHAIVKRAAIKKRNQMRHRMACR
ncbi:hypothetical protein [Nitrosomonas communis]|uniref:hypothetical protein n=1 Tax=Nitrosomonas communis TaxID=44574 RepID=UPI003D2DAF88